MKTLKKRIAAVFAATVMAIGSMSIAASAVTATYQKSWSFSWTYGANNQYAKTSTTFEIKVGMKTRTVTSSGKKYTCYYVKTTPYYKYGAMLSFVDSADPVKVQFTCPDYKLGTDYFGDTVDSGHVAYVDLVSGKVHYGQTINVKASALNASCYRSVGANGVAYSYDN